MRILYVLYFAGIAGVLYLVNTGQTGILKLVDYVPFRDKTIHFLLLGGAGLVANFLLRMRTFQVGRFALFVGSVVVLVGSTLEECSQMWIPTRTFSMFDMAANWLGILFFDACLRLALARGWVTKSLPKEQTGEATP